MYKFECNISEYVSQGLAPYFHVVFRQTKDYLYKDALNDDEALMSFMMRPLMMQCRKVRWTYAFSFGMLISLKF